MKQIVVGFLFYFFLNPYLALADSERPTYVVAPQKNTDEAKQVIQSILQDDKFQAWKEVERLRFKNNDDTENRDEPADPLSRDFIQFIAQLFEIVLWTIPLLVLWGLYRYRHLWPRLFNRPLQTDEQTIPEVVFGLDIRKESLPEDIPLTAQKLWHENRQREAVGILYRGALRELFTRYSIELPPGATEGDCLNLIRKYDAGSTLSYFGDLTRLWQMIAYAHRSPKQENFDLLCRTWKDNYGVTQ